MLLGPSVRALQYSPSTDDYIVQLWNTDSGLPDSAITSIAQTPDGYLWIGTMHGGLSRFDGSAFVNFEPGNAPELRSIEMHKLLVDQAGTLWIGNVEGGIISCRHGRFNFEYSNNNTPGSWIERIVAERKDEITFASPLGWIIRRIQTGGMNRWETIAPTDAQEASDLFEDSSGVIWYLTASNQVAQLRGTNSAILPHPPGLDGSMVTALAQDAAGRIWAATPNHLAVWNGKAFVDRTPTNAPRNFVVHHMIPCPGGGFWVQVQNFLRKYDGSQWTVMEDVATNGDTQEWPAASDGENFSLLFADKRGGAWFWRKPDGLGHISSSGQISWVQDADGKPLGMVQCWLEDHEGNVWFGLEDGGLARVQKRLFHLVWPQENVDSKIACSICQDPDGVIWLGTGAKNVLRWQHGAFTVFDPPIPEPFTETKVLPAADGGLWVGSVQNGLMQLKDGQFTRPFSSDSIGTVVRCLYQDHHGNLWIGNDFGLFRWDGRHLKNFTARDGFTPAYVTAITGDPSGDLWIGTALGELRRFRDGKFQTFLPKDSLTDKSMLKAAASANPLKQHKRGALTGGERFWAFYVDDDGVLWIGSLGGGLLRFQDGKFTRFTTRDGLPCNDVSQVLEDNNRRLWLGTRAGIVRVQKRELNDFANGDDVHPDFVTYGLNSGLPALECFGGSQPDCWHDRDGRLWFTTVRGAVWINPTTLHINHLPPPVHIEDVRVDGTSILNTNDAASTGSSGGAGKIRVAAGQHYFEFKFTALSFTAPEKVRFKWRLAGLTQHWMDGGTRRMAGFSYIPPGTYRFEVMACNNDGVWSDKSASIRFTVLPYFWETWWFKIAVALFVVAIVSAIYSAHIARVRALEKLRLRIARDLHDEVGANLGSISLLAEIMEHKPSTVDAAQVRHISSHTIDTLRDIIWFIDPSYDKLSDLAARLKETSRVMLSGVVCNFEQSGNFRSAGVSLAFRRNVPLIFKEALHNVLKHSRATRVAVSIRRMEKQFQFRVQDNGVGFRPGAKSPGNGLKNMKRRAEEIRGRLEIESSPGGGTAVTLTAPIT